MPEHIGRPKDENNLAEYMTTVLEKRRYGVVQPIGAQILHDMEITQHEGLWESVFDSMLIKMETDIFTEVLDTQEREVPFSNFEVVEFPSRKPHLVFAAVLSAMAIFAFAMGADTWVFLFIILAMFAGAIFDLLVTPREKRVDVQGVVEVEVESLLRFPENNKVYPKELGRPYKAVEIRTYKRYDDGSDDLEEEY